MDLLVSIEYNNKFFAVECNPRVTGANYPWELVSLLNNKNDPQDHVKYARAENIHLNRMGLSFQDLMVFWGKFLYTGDSPNGILIPFNVGPLASGKVTVLGTGSNLEELEEIFFIFLEDLLLQIQYLQPLIHVPLIPLLLMKLLN